MKKLLSIAALTILVCCASSSCLGGGATTIPEVEAAKSEAVKTVRSTLDNELGRAKDSINYYLGNEVKYRLSEGIDTVVTRHVNELSAIANNIKADYSGLKHSVDDLRFVLDSNVRWINMNTVLVVISIVLSILSFLFLFFKRPSEKRVNGIIQDSLEHPDRRVGDKYCFDAYERVCKIVDNKLNGDDKSSQKPEQVFNTQINAWLNNKHNQETIIRILGSQPNVVNGLVNAANNVANATYAANNVANATYAANNVANAGNDVNNNFAYQANNPGYAQSQPVTEYALYARERLANASKTYVDGKSIYKLILASENSTSASVVLCTEASERIIAISDYLEEDCCVFDKLDSHPTTVAVVNPGKAELRNGQWCLIDKVKVELR